MMEKYIPEKYKKYQTYESIKHEHYIFLCKYSGVLTWIAKEIKIRDNDYFELLEFIKVVNDRIIEYHSLYNKHYEKYR